MLLLTGTPSKRTKVQEFCRVCLKDGSGVSECLLCKKQVHQDTPCSIASRSGEKRTCIACSCKICKYPLTPNHTCSCVVCKKEHATQQHCMIQCKECEQAAHEVCGSKQNEQFTCARCHFAKGICFNLIGFQTICFSVPFWQCRNYAILIKFFLRFCSCWDI